MHDLRALSDALLIYFFARIVILSKPLTAIVATIESFFVIFFSNPTCIAFLEFFGARN